MGQLQELIKSSGGKSVRSSASSGNSGRPLTLKRKKKDAPLISFLKFVGGDPDAPRGTAASRPAFANLPGVKEFIAQPSEAGMDVITNSLTTPFRGSRLRSGEISGKSLEALSGLGTLLGGPVTRIVGFGGTSAGRTLSGGGTGVQALGSGAVGSLTGAALGSLNRVIPGQASSAILGRIGAAGGVGATSSIANDLILSGRIDPGRALSAGLGTAAFHALASELPNNYETIRNAATRPLTKPALKLSPDEARSIFSAASTGEASLSPILAKMSGAERAAAIRRGYSSPERVPRSKIFEYILGKPDASQAQTVFTSPSRLLPAKAGESSVSARDVAIKNELTGRQMQDLGQSKKQVAERAITDKGKTTADIEAAKASAAGADTAGKSLADLIAMSGQPKTQSIVLGDPSSNPELDKQLTDFFTKITKPGAGEAARVVSDILPREENADLSSIPIEYIDDLKTAGTKVMPQADGTQKVQSIQLNPKWSRKRQVSSLKHELSHASDILKGDYSGKPVVTEDDWKWLETDEGMRALAEVQRQMPDATQEQMVQQVFFDRYQARPEEVRARAATGLEDTTVKNRQQALRSLQFAAAPRTRPPFVLKANKGQIMEAIRPASAMIKKPENILNRELLRAEQKGSQTGYRAGKREATLKLREENMARIEQVRAQAATQRNRIVDRLRSKASSSEMVRRDIADYVKRNLPKSEQGKYLKRVASASTLARREKVFAQVNKAVEKTHRVALIREIQKSVKRIAESPSVAVDYRKSAFNIQKALDFKQRSDSERGRIEKTKQEIEKNASGTNVTLSERVRNKLKILDQVPAEKLSARKLDAILAEVRMIEKLGRLKYKSRENAWELEKREMLEQMKSGSRPLENLGITRPKATEDPITFMQKLGNKISKTVNLGKRIDKAITPMDATIDYISGGQGSFDQPGYVFTKGRIDADSNLYKIDRDNFRRDTLSLIKELGNLTEKERMRIGVHQVRSQEDGLQRLINGGYTQEEVDSIVLTDKEAKVYESMRKAYDDGFPLLSSYMEKVENKNVRRVNSYSPFVSDLEEMAELPVQERMLSGGHGLGDRKRVPQGLALSRTGPGEQVVKLDAVEGFLRYTDDLAYLINMGRDVKMIAEVVRSPEYGEMVGDLGQTIMAEWTNLLANKGGVGHANQIRWLDSLNNNISLGVLAFRLPTVLLQGTEWFTGMGMNGPKAQLEGTFNYLHDKRWRDVAFQFPEIKDRAGGEVAFQEIIADVEGLRKKIAQVGFKGLEFVDGQVAAMNAVSAYTKYLRENNLPVDPELPLDPDGVIYAQRQVRLASGGLEPKDLPPALSGQVGNRSINRTLLRFQNFALSRWATVSKTLPAQYQAGDKRGTVGTYMWFLMAAIAAVGIRRAYKEAWDQIVKGDSEGQKDDYATDVVQELISTVPIVGNLVSAVQYDSNPVPVISVAEGVVSGANRYLTGKKDKTKRRGLLDIAGGAGAFAGVPGSLELSNLIQDIISRAEQPKKRTIQFGGEGNLNTSGESSLSDLINR